VTAYGEKQKIFLLFPTIFKNLLCTCFFVKAYVLILPIFLKAASAITQRFPMSLVPILEGFPEDAGKFMNKTAEKSQLGWFHKPFNWALAAFGYSFVTSQKVFLNPQKSVLEKTVAFSKIGIINKDVHGRCFNRKGVNVPGTIK
jgi:hypothetical protein